VNAVSCPAPQLGPVPYTDTWRVYGIKKPLQIHGSTSETEDTLRNIALSDTNSHTIPLIKVTCAATKEEYYDLMNRHLAKEQQLPNMKKEQALASSKPKANQLRNVTILAERDVEFGKFLQGRVEGIEAKFEVSRQAVLYGSTALLLRTILSRHRNSRGSVKNWYGKRQRQRNEKQERHDGSLHYLSSPITRGLLEVEPKSTIPR
jgi:hypothetical protein